MFEMKEIIWVRITEPKGIYQSWLYIIVFYNEAYINLLIVASLNHDNLVDGTKNLPTVFSAES